MSHVGRILYAEDNENDVELTMAGFAAHNLANEVVVARDGAEALDYLLCRGPYERRSAESPSLVLLDLKMPRVDGLGVLREMRAHEHLRHTPAVILTSSREERDIVESYDLGVNGYVVKPVAFSDFIEAVKSIGLFWAVLNEPPRAGARRV